MIEKFAEAIIENLPDALYAINKDGEIVIWNKAIENLTGVKKKDVIGKGNYEYSYIFYGERVPGLVDTLLDKTGNVEKMYKNFVRNGNVVTGEKRLQNQNKILMGWASLLYDNDGNTLIGEVVIIKDITKEKENEINFLKIFEASPEPIAISDVESSKFLNVNAAWQNFMEITFDEIKKTNLTTVEFTKKYVVNSGELLKLISEGKNIKDFKVVLNINSAFKHGLFSCSYVLLDQRNTRISILKDTTQQVNLENYLKVIKQESEHKIDEYVKNQNVIFNEMMLKHNKEIKESLVVSQNIIKNLELKVINGGNI